MKQYRPMGVGEGDLELEQEYANIKQTRQRNDNQGTEFENWRRNKPELSSGLGYIATDIDFIWRNYKTGQFMFVEEKRYMSKMTFPQKQTFKVVDKQMKGHPLYMGFHLLQFENTTPDDGRVYWDGVEITKGRLLDILKFKNINNVSYFNTLTSNNIL